MCRPFTFTLNYWYHKMGHLAICFLFCIPLCSFFPVYLLINWIFWFHFTFFIGLLATALWLVNWMVVLGLRMFIFNLSQPVFKWSWFISHSSVVKNSAAVQETWVQSLGWEDPLEEGMASRSCIVAWRIPRTEERGGLQSMELQRVGHDWSNLARLHYASVLYFFDLFAIVSFYFTWVMKPVLHCFVYQSVIFLLKYTWLSVSYLLWRLK